MRFWRPKAKLINTPFYFIDGASEVQFLLTFAPEKSLKLNKITKQ